MLEEKIKYTCLLHTLIIIQVNTLSYSFIYICGISFHNYLCEEIILL
jgi:hypothetical protein